MIPRDGVVGLRTGWSIDLPFELRIKKSESNCLSYREEGGVVPGRGATEHLATEHSELADHYHEYYHVTHNRSRLLTCSALFFQLFSPDSSVYHQNIVIFSLSHTSCMGHINHNLGSLVSSSELLTIRILSM